MVTVWSRSKSKIHRLLSKKSTRLFPLPYEIVAAIIAHFEYDLRTLQACSLTCRSWYTVTASHLHPSPILARDRSRINLTQQKPLSELHELGLLDFLEKLRVKRLCKSWLISHAPNHPDIHHFFTLANVHTLKLEYVDIQSFIPGVEQYFKHFSPTLRSIALLSPRCTPRQLSHFLTLFLNLDNIEIQDAHTYILNKTIPDKELVPFSTPKLRGGLILRDFSWAETCTHLITFCGGLRFRYIRLPWNESYTRMLLEECAETLETVRFDTNDSEFCMVSSTDLS